MATTEIAELARDEDKETNPPGSDCLGTPVVLRIIMENFSNTELLEISLVNKLWNYEARSVLKNRGSFIAKLESTSPCEKVAAFASDLRQMNVVLFSGINIRLDDWAGCENCEASPTGALDPNYNIILDRVPWKNFRLHWGENWEKAKKCQAFLLAQKILQDFSGDLEEFQLRLGGKSKKFMEEILQDCKFPQLKTLDLRRGTRAPGENCTALTKALISRAPKLQVFHEEWWVSLKENVLEGSSAVLVAHGVVRPAYDELSEGILPSLRLSHILLEVKEQDFSVERFNRITPLLLQNSKTTLEGFSMDAAFVLPLMCYGVSFENVKALTLRMDYHSLQRVHPRVLILLKAFDFTRTFPNLLDVSLETVSNRMALDQVNEFVAQANVFLKQPMPDRAANIKHLNLSEHIEDCAIPFLVEMFPNTRNLRIYRKYGQDIPYVLIWQHFKGLERLSTQKEGGYYQNEWPMNLDSVICGIFPQEVAQLRTKDDEYLKKVNIVPVMPALTCLSGLKSLDMAIWDDDYDPEDDDGQRPPFFLSKVTGLLAFARMPNLSVSIHTELPKLETAMSHLRPYAEVYLED